MHHEKNPPQLIMGGAIGLEGNSIANAPCKEEKERKPPKERTVKPSRTGLCKSGQSTHGPATKSRNAATKGYNKRIYMTRKGNIGSKK